MRRRELRSATSRWPPLPPSAVLARPKSRSLTPALGDHDVAGLQVAVDDAPRLCAASSACVICTPNAYEARQVAEALPEPVPARVRPFEVLHHQEVERRPRGPMSKSAQMLGCCRLEIVFASRSRRCLRFGVVGEVGGDYLDRDGAVEPTCRGRGRPRPSPRRRWGPGSRRDRAGCRTRGP